MSRSTAKAICDPRTRQDGRSTVVIRVTHGRSHKYYKTNIVMRPEDFKIVMNTQRFKDDIKGNEKKKIHSAIKAFTDRAEKIIQDLPVFTFNLFEQKYLSNRDAGDTVSSAFVAYEQELREEGRIGSAVACSCARNSFDEFKKGLRFADLTPKKLKEYERWMIENGRSLTTVGMYMRGLRRMFNLAAVDKALYPFGEGKYEIPTGKNIKKALTLEEVGLIMNYEAETGSYTERARDYWIFLYLCNGMNVKDFCLLKHNNIDGDVLTYIRAKTKRTKKEQVAIQVSLKPLAKEVMRKWGVLSIAPDAYIFPHLNKTMTPERQREVYQQLTQNINKNMKRIAKDLGINKSVTTYFARHSFATVLKRAGVSTEFISDALGHESLGTTKNYLAGFEQEAIHKTTDVLLPNIVAV